MSKHHSAVSTEEAVALFELDLKNRAFAAVLAWLVPGLGHLYQGRTAKGLLFMVCLVSTFAFGYYIGDGRVAYAATEPLAIPGESLFGKVGRVGYANWKLIGQAGIGGVAIPCVVERQRVVAGKAPLLGEAFRPPKMKGFDQLPRHKDASGNLVTHPNELAEWQYKGGFRYELGAIYTFIAGLLNVLVIFDAYSGPLILRPNEPEKQPDKQPGKGKPTKAEG